MRESAHCLPRVPSASATAAGATALVPSKDRHRPVPLSFGRGSELTAALQRERWQLRHWDEVLAPGQGVGQLSHLSPLSQL